MSSEEYSVDELNADCVFLNAEHARLRPLFDKLMANILDWRGQFSAVIPEDKFNDYNDAVVFFTASPLVKQYTDRDGMVACTCVGYRDGPAGG
jgi:hypothetical protein